MASLRKSLATVIRLQRWQVNERRRLVGEADAAVQAIEAALGDLEARCAAERQHVAEAPETGAYAFGAFVLGIRARREALESERIAAEQRLSQARGALAEAYREQRKFEMVEAEQRRRAAEAAARQDQQALDEIALQRAARNGNAARS